MILALSSHVGILDYFKKIGLISGLHCSYETLDLHIAHCNGYSCKTTTKDAIQIHKDKKASRRFPGLRSSWR